MGSCWFPMLSILKVVGQGPSTIFMRSNDFSKLVYKITAGVEHR